MNKNEDLFYIRDKRQVVGNCALWWGPKYNGYTCEIDKAGKYTRAEAESITGPNGRGTDIAYPVKDVDAAAIRHVRLDLIQGGALKPAPFTVEARPQPEDCPAHGDTLKRGRCPTCDAMRDLGADEDEPDPMNMGDW